MNDLCRFVAVGLALGVLSVCAIGQPPTAADDLGSAAVVVSGLVEPVAMAAIPGDDTKLLVTEKAGKLRVINVTSQQGGQRTYQLVPTPALDITAMTVPFGNAGFTGITVSPNFAANGHIYIFHNRPIGTGSVTAVARYTRATVSPLTFDPASRQEVWSSPAGLYHHGGTVKFGPDGMLFITKGDEGDQFLRCRNPGSFYGKILRIDPTFDEFPNDPARNYGIPPGNMFPNGTSGVLPEIWAMGLRSPWQLSFDRFTGDCWAADVGELSWEEVTFIPASAWTERKDLGWPNYEGSRRGPFGVIQPDPDVSLLRMPIYDYPHTAQPGYEQWQVGCSVTGGVVYRGSAMRLWRGRYFFADICSNRVSSFVEVNGAMTDLQDMTSRLRDVGLPTQRPPFSVVASFGEDNDGEIFLVELGNGTISKIVPQGNQPPLADVAGANQSPGPDGLYTADDVIVFLGWFLGQDARADCAGPNQSPIVDQVLSPDDVIVFFSAFFEGR